jgi:GNAT superfamily N-acetyltransferase
MEPSTAVIRELLAGETQLAHRAMAELRRGYAEQREFVERVDGVLRPSGYRLIGSFPPGGDEAVAVAGFRTGENLAWGRYLYVDDLSSLPESRRQGHAGALLEWLVLEARRLDCAQLHLDSGTEAARFDAHRLYHKHGLSIRSHHFGRGL